MFNLRCKFYKALVMASCFSTSPTQALEAKNLKAESGALVADCHTVEQPYYSLRVVENPYGLYDVKIRDTDGRTWYGRDWVGTLTDDKIEITDSAHPASGSMSVYRSSNSDRYEGGVAILDIEELSHGRVVRCNRRERAKPLLSCVNNALNSLIHAVDVYPSAFGFQLLIKYLDGDEERVDASGQVDGSSMRLYAEDWRLDADRVSSYWRGSLYDSNGIWYMMVCLQ